jgi:hypothetical protein
MIMVRNFSELIKLKTFDERFAYLKLPGEVGTKTFGFDRWVNQKFYTSREWQQIRNHVIARDLGCDLSLPGMEIYDVIYIHHMNPMSIEDLLHSNSDILDTEFLVCTSRLTHLAIHYGNRDTLSIEPIVRRPKDTKLW